MPSKTDKSDAPVETPEVPEEPKLTKKQEKQQARVLDAATAAWVQAHARPAVGLCLCGCGSETKGRFFPGHDALLKERLRATVELAEGEAKASAEAALATFGW